MGRKNESGARNRKLSLVLDKPGAMRRLFARYAETMPSGYNWQSVHCINPEHIDEEESASVNSIEGKYKCHGCGLRGDAYDLVQELEGVDFKTSISILDGDGDAMASSQEQGRMTWL